MSALQKCISICYYKQGNVSLGQSISMHNPKKLQHKQIGKAIQNYCFINYKDEQYTNIYSTFYQQKQIDPIFKCLHQQHSKPKQQKDLKPHRLSFKKLSFHQTIVSKRQITLGFARRKNEELQLSFQIQGKKFKLITTSDVDKTSIIHKRSSYQIEIKAKSAMKLQYTNEKHKKTEISKQYYTDITINCNYGCKNYDPHKIEIFFTFHHCNYCLQGPNGQAKLTEEESFREGQKEQCLLDFDLPIDAKVDWPIQDLLSSLNPSSQLIQFNNLKEEQSLSRQNSTAFDAETPLPYYQEIKFRQLTPQEINQTYPDRLAITRLDKKQKFKILNNIFKIQNVKVEDYAPYTKPKCLYKQCRITFNHHSELQKHLQTRHPRLVSLGVRVDEKGRYDCSERALDYALILGKIFPKPMKIVIKQSKTRSS